MIQKEHNRDYITAEFTLLPFHLARGLVKERVILLKRFLENYIFQDEEGNKFTLRFKTCEYEFEVIYRNGSSDRKDVHNLNASKFEKLIFSYDYKNREDHTIKLHSFVPLLSKDLEKKYVDKEFKIVGVSAESRFFFGNMTIDQTILEQFVGQFV